MYIVRYCTGIDSHGWDGHAQNFKEGEKNMFKVQGTTANIMLEWVNQYQTTKRLIPPCPGTLILHGHVSLDFYHRIRHLVSLIFNAYILS